MQLQQKLERLRNKQAEQKALQKQLKNSGDKQVVSIDADAGLLTKRGQTIAGYNAQIAVDGKYKWQ